MIIFGYNNNYLATINSADGTITSAEGYINIAIPNSQMIFGYPIVSTFNQEAIKNIDNQQLALFKLVPELINSGLSDNESYWLRDFKGGTKFAYVGAEGVIDSLSGDSLCGIRPIFAIC